MWIHNSKRPPPKNWFPVEDSFIEELELLREDELASDFVVEGQFLTELEMFESWGWTEYLGKSDKGVCWSSWSVPYY